MPLIINLIPVLRLVEVVKDAAEEGRQKERPFVPEELKDSSVLPGENTNAGSSGFSKSTYSTAAPPTRQAQNTNQDFGFTTPIYEKDEVREGKRRRWNAALGRWAWVPDQPNRLVVDTDSDGFLLFEYTNLRADAVNLEGREFALPYAAVDVPAGWGSGHENFTSTVNLDARDSATMVGFSTIKCPGSTNTLFDAWAAVGLSEIYNETFVARFEDGSGGSFDGGLFDSYYLPYTDDAGIVVWVGWNADLNNSSLFTYTTQYTQDYGTEVSLYAGGPCERVVWVAPSSACTSGGSTLINQTTNADPLVLCFLVGNGVAKQVSTPPAVSNYFSSLIGGPTALYQTSNTPKQVPSYGKCLDESAGGSGYKTIYRTRWGFQTQSAPGVIPGIARTWPDSSGETYTPAIYSALLTPDSVTDIPTNSDDWLAWYKQQPNYYQDIDAVLTTYQGLTGSGNIPTLVEPDNLRTWNWDAPAYCEDRLLELGFTSNDLVFTAADYANMPPQPTPTP